MRIIILENKKSFDKYLNNNTIRNMIEKWKFLDEITKLVSKWYVIHRKYNVWDEYSYEKIWNSTIMLTLRNNYEDPRSGLTKIVKNRVLDRTFRALIKDSSAETVSPPNTKELWYDDSLRWLYHHYKFGETDGSNVVLLNGQWRIIAIQYNGMGDVSFINSWGVHIIPEYIVLNNKYKLEWVYMADDYPVIEVQLKELFNI